MPGLVQPPAARPAPQIASPRLQLCLPGSSSSTDRLVASRQQQRRRRSTTTACRSSSSSAGAAASWGPSPPPQQPDVVSGVLDTCLSATAGITEAAVGRLADALQGVAPPGAPRPKIEAAVKGGLLLLLLCLLKGVLSFVLLVGCAGLVVFTATQVFGWSALSSGRGGGDVNYSHQHQHQRPPGRAQHHHGSGGGGAAGAGQQGQQQQRNGWPPQGPAGWQQGDLADVWQYNQQPAQ